MQAIDALALCDVDGRLFLEMDEEDLAESDELGLDVRRIRMDGSSGVGRVTWQHYAYVCTVYRTLLTP